VLYWFYYSFYGGGGNVTFIAAIMYVVPFMN